MKNGSHTLLWAATHMGGLHQCMGLCNQDAHALRLWKNRALCVVADGVGSAALSHEGARAICRLAVQFFSTLPAQAEVDASLLEQLQQQWVDSFSEGKIKDYATTCRLIYATTDAVHIANLGDGGTIVITSEDIFCHTCDKDNDFSNSTDALSGSNGKWTVNSYPADQVRAVFAMTDGIYEDIDEDVKKTFAQDLHLSFQPLSSRMAHREMQKVLRAWAGSGDDKTIVALFRKEEHWDE